MTNKPTASVIIPTYNSEKYIYQTISHLGQLSDIEIIVVDDGSEDHTVEVLNSFINKKNIKIIRSKHIGPGGARNIGMQNASSDIITFVDSDDKIDLKIFASALNNVANDFDEHTLYVGKKIEMNNFKYWKCSFNDFRNAILFPTSKNYYLTSSCLKFFSTKIISQNNVLFPTNLTKYEDVTFLLRYISCINSIDYFDGDFYKISINGQSLTRKQRDDILENSRGYLETISELLSKKEQKGVKTWIYVMESLQLLHKDSASSIPILKKMINLRKSDILRGAKLNKYEYKSP